MHFVLSFISSVLHHFKAGTDAPIVLIWNLYLIWQFYFRENFLLFLETRRQHNPLACIFHFLHLRGCILTENLRYLGKYYGPTCSSHQPPPSSHFSINFKILTTGHCHHKGGVFISIHSSFIVSCFPNSLFFPRKYS